MGDLLKKLGLTVNDLLKSTLTLFLYFALIAGVTLWLFKSKIPLWSIAGFVLGAFYFLFINARNNGGSQGDAVFAGGLNDLAGSSSNPLGGRLYDPRVINNLDLGDG